MSSSKAALVYSSSSCRKHTLRYQTIHMLKMIYYTTHTLDSMLHITPPLSELISQRQRSFCLLYFMSEVWREFHRKCVPPVQVWGHVTTAHVLLAFHQFKIHQPEKQSNVQIRTFKAVSHVWSCTTDNEIKRITFMQYISLKLLGNPKHVIKYYCYTFKKKKKNLVCVWI